MVATAQRFLTRLGDRAPVASYGGGGFRFGELRHHGSVLILASGFYALSAANLAALDAAAIVAMISGGDAADFLLLGTGDTQQFPDQPMRLAFDAAGIGLEAMATGPACRTFNILYAEQRHFAAALIAV